MDVLDLMNDHNQVGPGHDIAVRPYVCAHRDCDKAFARKSDLARHFRIHTGDKPYVCLAPNCGKAFIQRSALTVHTRTHTGEKPHLCENCYKAFADSSSLARHRRIHTGKRPYICLVPGCDRAFARRNTFLKHHKRTHPDLPTPASSAVTRGSKNVVVPYPVRSQSGRILQPGPPGQDGQPQYYISTPTTANGPPHGNAAHQHPSEGAAYAFGGYIGNGDGGGGGGGFGPIRTRGRKPFDRRASTQSLITTPATSGPGSIGFSKPDDFQAVRTPISATQSSGGDCKSEVISPSTSIQDGGLYKFGGGGTGGANGRVVPSQGGPGGALGPRSSSQSTFYGPPGSHINVGSAQYGNDTYQGGHPGYTSVPHSHQVWQGRSASQGVMYAKSENVNGLARNFTEPANRSDIGWQQTTGGAYHGTHLTIPSYAHGTPLYTSRSAPGTMHATSNHSPGSDDDDTDLDSDSDDNERSRGSSAEPLIDVRSVPTFSFQSASGAALPFPLQAPFSAIEAGQRFNPLTNGPPQFAVAPPSDRLHSAPPQITRFNSAPAVPQLQTNWGSSPLYPGPVSNGVVPGTQSQIENKTKEDKEWEELEEQMLSREATSDPTQALRPPSEDNSAVTNLPKPVENNHWGAPLHYPIPPIQIQPPPAFSSAASTTSTASSTLVNQSQPILPPMSLMPDMFGPPHSAQSAVFSTMSTPGYPAPMTPYSAWSQQHQYMPDPSRHVSMPSYYVPTQATHPMKAYHPVLSSPANIYPGGRGMYHAPDSSMGTITLTTPPKGMRKDSGGVATVGLGIAGVNFQDRPIFAQGYPIAHPDQVENDPDQVEEGRKIDPYEEGEDELDSGADAGEEEDDSDDEYMPGKKSKKGKKGKGKGGKKVSRRKS